MKILTTPVPLWLLLIGIAVAMALSFAVIEILRRRLDGHSRSISNMVDWADAVEDKFAEMEFKQQTFFSDVSNRNEEIFQTISRPRYRA